MPVIVRKDVVLEVMADTLDSDALTRLDHAAIDRIVESCFTRLGGSGLVRWVQCNDSGEPPLPGHHPFSAALIQDEDFDAGRRIIARTVEAFR